MNQDIINFIKESRLHGVADSEIKQELLSAGWEAHVVEDNFVHLKALTDKPLSNRDEDINISNLEKSNPLQSPVQKNSQQILTTYTPASGAAYNTQRSFTKNIVFLFIGIFFIIFGIVLYAYSVLGVYNPKNVWQKWWVTELPEYYTARYEGIYKNKTNASSEQMLNVFYEIYQNSAASSPETQIDIGFVLETGEKKYEKNLTFLAKQGFSYVNTKDFKELLAAYNPSYNPSTTDWIRFDIETYRKEFEKIMGENNSNNQVNEFKEKFTASFSDLTVKHNPIITNKPKGLEKIGGKLTLKSEITIDTAILSDLIFGIFENSLNVLSTESASVANLFNKESSDKLNAGIREFLSGLNIKQIQVWTGVFDGQLSRLQIIIDVPGFAGGIENLPGILNTLGKNRDAERLVDVIQIRSALEDYKLDHSRFPESKNGQPLALENYFSPFPEAPVPTDGNCTEYFNTYWYQVAADGQSYEMTFCLGESAGGYLAGINKLTEEGISPVNDCPSTPLNCFKNNQSDGQITPDEQKPIGEFTFEINLNNLKKPKEITVPQEFIDSEQILQNFKNNFDLIRETEPINQIQN